MFRPVDKIGIGGPFVVVPDEHGPRDVLDLRGSALLAAHTLQVGTPFMESSFTALLTV